MNKETQVAESAVADASAPNLALRELRRVQFGRILAYAKDGKTDLAPDVEHTDVSFFLDPHLYEREFQKFFRETPLVACLSRDLPEPGSYRLFDDAGVPIIVWRGKDNQVRAFLNICAHRGARIGRETCGKAARLTCRFHGWTYDTMGQVVGIPEEGQFCAKIDDQKHLVPIPVEERHGLVFVLPTPGAKMDLDAHLDGFGAQLAALDLGRATLAVEDELHNTSNWKYTLDTYFENYHLPVLHRDTLAPIFAHNLNIFETWGTHHRFTWPFGNIYEFIGKPESEWNVDALPLTHFLFPNMHMSVGSLSPKVPIVFIARIFPKAVGELVAKISIYSAMGDQSDEASAEIKKGYVRPKYVAEEEDYSVTGESWPRFAALPAGTKFAVGRHEIGVQNFHNNMRKHVGG